MKDKSYLSFKRNSWAEFRKAVPLSLTNKDLEKLQGINENLSLTEVEEVYLPISRLLNLIVLTSQTKGTALDRFLGQSSHHPFVISIAGSVAVGKSTTARVLKTLLMQWPEHPKVDLITTDGFLYPLNILKEKKLLERKGFPESYDTKYLLDVISRIKYGDESVTVPLYSHITYDRLPNKKIISRPDILIIEGLNVLQVNSKHKKSFVSDFVDFSIYVDAEFNLLKAWYIDRFLKFRESSFSQPGSYFSNYSKLNDIEATKVASNIWDKINGVNLVKNIEPTRSRADLILQKNIDHSINRVLLRNTF